MIGPTPRVDSSYHVQTNLGAKMAIIKLWCSCLCLFDAIVEVLLCRRFKNLEVGFFLCFEFLGAFVTSRTTKSLITKTWYV